MERLDNFEKAIFPGDGRYDIPLLNPETADGLPAEWIPFNYASSETRRADKGAHFFLDDYQFERTWNDPDRYTKLLSEFSCVLAPDFSTYRDMPMAMQLYNHYRKHWLGAYWQMHGLRVIPTISWSTPESYDWCFSGEPVGGVVAVSSVGCLKNKDATRLFLAGYEEMMKRLDPSFVIFYGKVPDACDWNVIRIQAHQDQMVERRKRKWAAEAAQVGSAR